MAMQFVLDKDHKDTLFEQAYFQLLTALHMGKVRPGDRLPSVRQVAQRNSINLKTAFAIYRRLQDEGYVTLRTGSGAYVSDVDAVDLEQAYCLSIFKTIRSNITEAGRLKVSPREYAKLVQGYVNRSRLRLARVAVVECNDEQINIFAHDISRKVGIVVQPILLSCLESPDRRTSAALSRVDYIATTHFHFKQVSALTAKYQKKLLQLSLNPTFITRIIEAARRGPVVMMVSNADYFPAFRESLLQTGTPPALVGRIAAADHTDLDHARFLAAHARTIYISPIASPSLRKLHPAHAEELNFDSTLSGESLEMLEAIILFSPRPS
jgi:DNA-binding transcriptional regulator YhcF (GntR family)